MDSLISQAEEQRGLLSKPMSYSSEPVKSNDMDAELEEILATKKATIRVVGVGGAGNNSITRMTEVGINTEIHPPFIVQTCIIVLIDPKLKVFTSCAKAMAIGAIVLNE